MMKRRGFLALTAVSAIPFLAPLPAFAAAPTSGEILSNWYRLILELVRHTATYTPPVASRAFAYLGVTAYEAVASGNPAVISLAGQLNALTALPVRGDGVFDDAAVLHSAMTTAVRAFFSNTGPTGQRAMNAMQKQLDSGLSGLDPEIAARSASHGQAVAEHILAWSQDDGGAVIDNMGFPQEYTPKEGPAHWVPSSLVRQQQAPLLPNWGNNRTFAMQNGASCGLPSHPEYSEDPASEFYAQAMEVVTTKANLTKEQKLIARFWSDDPMLSPTPPGHWISIALQIIARDALDVARSADLLARLGIAVADGFIGCWHAKFEYDLLRPVTYIRRVIDKKWEPLLITPPFPEYPSGHSTQSGAAAAVLTAFFGEGFAFSDATHVDDGIPARDFPDFWAAASEAALSRMYGGIHFRAANENGLEQGRCIGAYAAGLKTVL